MRFVLFKNKDMHIYERDLSIHSKTNSIISIKAVIDKDNNNSWNILIYLRGVDMPLMLVSQLNKPRTFADLNRMIKLLRKQTNFNEITVQLQETKDEKENEEKL